MLVRPIFMNINRDPTIITPRIRYSSSSSSSSSSSLSSSLLPKHRKNCECCPVSQLFIFFIQYTCFKHNNISKYSKLDLNRQNGERDLPEDIYITAKLSLSCLPQAKVFFSKYSSKPATLFFFLKLQWHLMMKTTITLTGLKDAQELCRNFKASEI